MARRKAAGLITCTPTPLNVWVLGRIAAGRRCFPNALEPTSTAHIRRCLKAGYVEVVPAPQMYRAMQAGRPPARATGTMLRITEAGYAALVDAIATRGENFPLPDGAFTTEVVS